MLLLFSIVSVALGVLLVLHPFDAAVSAVMLCGILLIAEGALNLGCILYAAMEPVSYTHLRALHRPVPLASLKHGLLILHHFTNVVSLAVQPALVQHIVHKLSLIYI